ncbi:hypothetical protein [Haliea sp. E17]|uniref:hypothetical protein n=1 Tax=Haliea sp. E17 TaxID=3401576 RepID=UPI003AB0C0DD
MKKFLFGLCCASLGFLLAASVSASDHADPIFNKKSDAGLTGLFIFPDGDQLVAILNIHPGLNTQPPFDLADYRYNLFFDTHTKVSYDDDQDLRRYGGSIDQPEGISGDVHISVSLNDDVSVRESVVEGLDPGAVTIWTGVRDDPFIFPKFFGTNVIAIVVRIPMAAFGGREDFLIWGTSEASSRWGGSLKQLDHVGRSLRTMNPRLDFLNTLPPSEHVAAIRKRHDSPGFFQKLLMSRLAPLFAIRHYDLFPDVAIYTTRRVPGYPNGRRLPDDIAALACQTGDCLLWELSYADSEAWPRQTINDKPFLSKPPYLAEPW